MKGFTLSPDPTFNGEVLTFTVAGDGSIAADAPFTITVVGLTIESGVAPDEVLIFTIGGTADITGDITSNPVVPEFYDAIADSSVGTKHLVKRHAAVGV